MSVLVRIQSSFIVRLANGGWSNDLGKLTIVPMVYVWRWEG